MKLILLILTILILSFPQDSLAGKENNNGRGKNRTTYDDKVYPPGYGYEVLEPHYPEHLMTITPTPTQTPTPVPTFTPSPIPTLTPTPTPTPTLTPLDFGGDDKEEKVEIARISINELFVQTVMRYLFPHFPYLSFLWESSFVG